MGEELEELRYNLQVSFSRMKDDIHYNREQVEMLIELNRKLQEQLSKVVTDITAMKGAKGLESEFMRKYQKNKKGLIKQRILRLAAEGRYSVAQLKDLVVDEKKYCSKATFYRYVDSMKKHGRIEIIEINGIERVIPSKQMPQMM
jgi:hypothetical protein